jgi:uncharacterized protein YndB with AHSA1/START domain
MVTASKAGTTMFTTPSDREVAATRVFDAPRSLVWEALTDPRHIPNWMLGPEGWTMPVCEVDLRPGGKWRFVWRKTNGSEMALDGEYRAIVRPERLVYTESWGKDWAETINTYVLSEEGGRTTVVCTVLYPSKEERDRALETEMKEGWSQGYDRLDKYLPTIA